MLKWAGLTLLVVAAGVGVYVARYWDRSYDDVPAPPLEASSDPAAIARGEYLVFGPAHCVDCHTGNLQEFLRYVEDGTRPPLAGGFPFPIGPLGTIYSRNITSDPETGIGRYSDGQIARMLRHGVRADGQASIPQMMPFANMSDEDVVGILSFLRTLPPVKRAVPDNQWTLFGKVMRTFVSATKPRLDGTPPKTSPPSEPTVERGRYLAESVADCGGCHSPFSMTTGALTGPRYSGGDPPMEPTPAPGVDRSLYFVPPNITPLPGSALSKFPDRATFVARFKNGGRKYAGSPMPWEALARTSPEDIGALYEFLKTVPPSGKPAPEEPTVKQVD